MVRFIIGFIIVIIILDMLGINTRSIIATAEMSGIAIAFGAQTIIQDFIKGMFMIIDDTIRGLETLWNVLVSRGQWRCRPKAYKD